MTRLEIATEKERLRRKILGLRDQQTSNELKNKSSKITEAVLGLPEYRKSKVVACYVDKGSEVKTRPLIRKVLAARKKVLVPIVDKESQNLLYSEIGDLDELTPGAFGILEPKLEHRKLTDLATANVVFVPGIAWDFGGYRLGWGKGYFDLVLKRLPDKLTSIGLAFDLQVVERVPRAQFDLPVDILVTESRVVHCHG